MRTRHTKRLLFAVLGVAVSAGALASKVYVADEEANTVSVVDAASFKLLRTISVGREPHNVQVSPDGKLVWVTSNGDAGAHKGMPMGEHAAMSERGEVWAIDTASDAVIAKVAVGKHPAHVVVTPDNRAAYVTNGVVVDRDGRYAYVTNIYANSVSVLELKERKVVATVPVGKGPNGISVTP